MSPSDTVLFVCEHGAAKSVVAAAHFNRLAAARGLSARAVARGTDPDAEVGAHVVAGLGGDGLAPEVSTPVRVDPSEVGGATRVVTFGALDLGATPTRLDRWDDVPAVSDGYDTARDAIVRRVEELLGELGRTAAFSIREARPDDAVVIAHHRAQMFRDMGSLPDDLVEPLSRESRSRLPDLIAAGVYLGWLAEVEASGQVVAGVGLYVRPLLPRPVRGTDGTVLVDREGIVLNAYTEPAYRRRGLARSLLTRLLAWTREHELARVVLHASDDGRALYESLGFVPSSEMRLASGGAPSGSAPSPRT